ncbi:MULTISPECIES: hypothetical protein [unclassified Nocardioides]|uniref:hypothetical protein n=1 Tax=unclassified Nocardioides TaxID=2615069 RepID=UPI0030142C8D
MRDARRGLLSALTEVPFGISAVADGRVHRLDYSVIPDTPLRQQMRDAALVALIDQGGRVRSIGSARAYRDAAIYAHDLLSRSAQPAESPLDIRTLSVSTLHAVLFENRMSPATVRTTLARRMLFHAADCLGVESTARYLRNLRLHGFASPIEPYTEAELECVIDWCKTRLNSLFTRRREAFALIGADPDVENDEEILVHANAVLNEPLDEMSRDQRWWVAEFQANGFRTPPPPVHRRAPYRLARQALFPDALDAQAAALLVINEYGAEASMLISMDITDVRREANNSSVIIIKGIKTRADKAVSRKGNAVALWSGGRVLERWIDATSSLRRWTGTHHLWLWVQGKESPKTVLHPVATFVPERPIILEGGSATLEMPGGGTVRMSTRKMRKTWMARADRAFGAGFGGALDPNHDIKTAWTFYRSVGLSHDERLAVIAEAQDDYFASIKGAGLIVTDRLGRDEAKSLLVSNGVEPAAAERMLRGDVSDSGTTACKDPYKAPGQAEGTLCRKVPYACLLCPNAVHTTAHLPVVLALREHIENQRDTLPAEDFVARWAGVDMGVERVIEAFSSMAVNKARQDIAAARERIERLRGIYG